MKENFTILKRTDQYYDVYDRAHECIVANKKQYQDAVEIAYLLNFYHKKGIEEGIAQKEAISNQTVDILEIPKTIQLKIYQKPLALHSSAWIDSDTIVERQEYLCTYTKILENIYNIPENYLKSMLGDVFEEFNMDYPDDFPSRSLSAGDVVQLNNQYWLCCSEGWTQIYW